MTIHEDALARIGAIVESVAIHVRELARFAPLVDALAFQGFKDVDVRDNGGGIYVADIRLGSGMWILISDGYNGLDVGLYWAEDKFVMLGTGDAGIPADARVDDTGDDEYGTTVADQIAAFLGDIANSMGRAIGMGRV